MATRKKAKKSARKAAPRKAKKAKKAARRKAAPKATNVSAVGMLKAFMQGKFKTVSQGLEQKAHHQIAELRKSADQKSITLHRQIEDLRKDVNQRVRQEAKRDLKKVESKLMQMTSRLKGLEKRVVAKRSAK